MSPALATAAAMAAAIAAPIPFGAAYADTFPKIVISKAEAKHEWPFSLDEGELTCVKMGQPEYVFFSEILTPEEMGEIGSMKLPRSVVVTANPLAFLATMDNRELYAPFDTLETLIKRLAPYEVMGRALCAQDQKLQDL